jgi:N-acylneuraminate cytidylyltransferase
MNAIAVIPARGGSKRIPNKNIINVGGRPLIAWMIDAAKAVSFLRDSVYVSTDSEEIASVAEYYGASVIFRPVELSTDYVWTEPVINHAVEEIEAIDNIRFSHVFWLNPCVLELKSRDIELAYEKLLQNNLREVISVDAFGISNSGVRVLIREALEQSCLSAKFGVITLPYRDINEMADLLEVDQKISSTFVKNT